MNAIERKKNQSCLIYKSISISYGVDFINDGTISRHKQLWMLVILLLILTSNGASFDLITFMRVYIQREGEE